MKQPVTIHSPRPALMARALVPITLHGKTLYNAGVNIKVYPSDDEKNYYATKAGRQFVIPGAALEILGKVE